MYSYCASTIELREVMPLSVLRLPCIWIALESMVSVIILVYSAVLLFSLYKSAAIITLAEFKYQRTQCSLAFVTPEKHSTLDSARAAVTSRCSLAG